MVNNADVEIPFLLDSSMDILGSRSRERMARFSQSDYLLTRLSEDKSFNVRLAVAANSFTPPSVLLGMLKVDQTVVFSKTFINNPNLPDSNRRQLIVSLLSSTYPGVEDMPYEWVIDLYTHFTNIGVDDNE